MKRLILSALVGIASSLAAPAQDVAAVKTSFNKCTACRAIGEGAKNKVGPELNGLDGPNSGTASNFPGRTHHQEPSRRLSRNTTSHPERRSFGIIDRDAGRTS